MWSLRQGTLQTAATMKSYPRLRSEHAVVARTAEVDSLTDVANRRAFDSVVESMRVSLDERRVAVLIIDVDDFKRVNDTRGHAAGDSVLRIVAGVLAAEVRTGDIVARLGGDEFGVLLPGAGPDAAYLVADRMAKTINAIEGGAVTVSIGVANGASSAVLDTLHAADSAMYVAKRAGGNPGLPSHAGALTQLPSDDVQEVAWVTASAATMALGRVQGLPRRAVRTQPAARQSARPAVKWTLLRRSPSATYAARLPAATQATARVVDETRGPKAALKARSFRSCGPTHSASAGSSTSTSTRREFAEASTGESEPLRRTPTASPSVQNVSVDSGSATAATSVSESVRSATLTEKSGVWAAKLSVPHKGSTSQRLGASTSP